MLRERRQSPRSRIHLYFHKYVDGEPYLCEGVELSLSGLLLRQRKRARVKRLSYAIELAPPPLGGSMDEPLLLCARPIWASSGFEALDFIAPSAHDRDRLATLLEACERAARLETVIAKHAFDA